jgi:hypothetical protein
MEHNFISMFVTPLSSPNVIPHHLDIGTCVADLTGFKTFFLNCMRCFCTAARFSDVHYESDY